ncbi:uncharacterized protein LOC122248080 [Penaeus japonicus]|uniref:uncharacterized protein LOC122248080 n=1 Tax=Penaeus japonicus TaxID=27405 RepID=UPI001C70FF9C|nr:uncharacterized protein LOC122248080 [Penaeus japonicus]
MTLLGDMTSSASSGRIRSTRRSTMSDTLRDVYEITAVAMLVSPEDESNEVTEEVVLPNATLMCMSAYAFEYREDHPQQEGFVEILEKKSDLDFFKHLRVTRSSFDTIIKDIEGVYGSRPSGTNLNLGPKNALYMTLWYLGTPVSYREVSELFGVSEGVTFGCVQENYRSTVFSWQKVYKMANSDFQALLMAVEYLDLVNFSVRWELIQYHVFLLRTCILLETAFALHQHLMVPFRDTGSLTVTQITFNKRLSRTRSVIENEFALFKGRFRRLKYIDADVERIGNIIKACCVLHNITLEFAYEEPLLVQEEGIAQVNEATDTTAAPNRDKNVSGERKRMFLASLL